MPPTAYGDILVYLLDWALDFLLRPIVTFLPRITRLEYVCIPMKSAKRLTKYYTINSYYTFGICVYTDEIGKTVDKVLHH